MSDVTAGSEVFGVVRVRPWLTVSRPVFPALAPSLTHVIRLSCSTVVAVALLVPNNVINAKVFKANMAAHNAAGRYIKSR